MAAKTECDRCKKVFDSRQDRSSSIHTVAHGAALAGAAHQESYDFCTTCTVIALNAVRGVLNGKG